MNNNQSKIHVEFVFPPIPLRQFDYQATRENYEPEDAIGYGPTAEEAVKDLIENEKSWENRG